MKPRQKTTRRLPTTVRNGHPGGRLGAHPRPAHGQGGAQRVTTNFPFPSSLETSIDDPQLSISPSLQPPKSKREDCLSRRPESQRTESSVMTKSKASSPGSSASASATRRQHATARPGKARSLACRQCRDRKIRCDGARPVCDSCSRRGLCADQCVYPEIEHEGSIASSRR